MNGWKLFARFHGLEICWLAMMGVILIANSKGAGLTALMLAGSAWVLGYGSAKVLSNATNERQQ